MGSERADSGAGTSPRPVGEHGTLVPISNALRQKCRGLRHLLAANTELLEMMADLEQGVRRLPEPLR